jgi:hypothetical protein
MVHSKHIQSNNYFEARLAFSSTMEGVCSAQVQAQNKHSRGEEREVCEGEMNKRKLGSFALCVMFFAFDFPAEAQQTKKVPRIGYLSALDPASESTRSEPFGRLCANRATYKDKASPWNTDMARVSVIGRSGSMV